MLVITGGASGIDTIAFHKASKLGICNEVVEADWTTHGKVAGVIRNRKMLLLEPDVVWAFYPTSGITKGTKDMVSSAKVRFCRIGVSVLIYVAVAA